MLGRDAISRNPKYSFSLKLVSMTMLFGTISRANFDDSADPWML